MTPGRKTALVAGGAVGLVLAAMVAFSKDLAIAYRISELRGNPGLATAWVAEPAHSVRGLALRRYARTAHGVEALRRLLLASVFDLHAADHPEFLPAALRPGQIIQFGVYQVATSQPYLLADGPRTLTLPLSGEAGERLRPRLALVDLVTPGELELPEHPGVRFWIWSYREDGEGRPPVLEVQMTGKGEAGKD